MSPSGSQASSSADSHASSHASHASGGAAGSTSGSASGNGAAPIDLLDELAWRGLLHQCTDEPGLREHLGDPSNHPRKAYIGFDPTSDSLTIGNLVAIMLLVHFQRAGHTPIVVMGGGTGLIGDPSGKSAERQLMTVERVEANVASQRDIFARIWRHAPLLSGDVAAHGASWATPALVNNADWLSSLSFIEVLRDTGKHFSVNMMIQKDSVRDRLHNREQGLSFTEFSYMILQAYDFAHLCRTRGVTLQMGGSDQWGNIVAGADLIRRLNAQQRTDADDKADDKAAGSGSGSGSGVFGLTAPLVTKADGGKFGKTESGAVWLTQDRTTPYAFFQFWLNTDDSDLPRFLKLFTLLPEAQITALLADHAANPGARTAHRALAVHMTTLLYGPDEAAQADAASRALFSGALLALPLATLTDVLADVPSSDHDRALLAGEGVSLVDLLVQTTLAKSKRESREFLSNGSVSVNGEKVGLDTRLTTDHLLHDTLIALRRGKKSWHVTRWRQTNPA